MSDVFGDNARLELIEGDIIEMAAIGDRHALCVRRILRLFSQLVGDDALVDIQNPVVLDERTEVQPDLSLLLPPLERYQHHPRPADVLLVIEVADSSVRFDLLRKAPLYGRAGIVETWVVDLTADAVVVFDQPGDGGYGRGRRFERGAVLRLSSLPDRKVSVDQVIGPSSV